MSANPLVLRAFVALDALQRGQGTRGLLSVLGQSMAVSENLCLAGYYAEGLQVCRSAKVVLLRMARNAQNSSRWRAKEVEYTALREAVNVFDRQLQSASHEDVRVAELKMLDTVFGNASDTSRQRTV